MKKSIMLLYIKFILLIASLCILCGFILPFFISYPDTFLCVAGTILIITCIPLLSILLYSTISDIVKKIV